MMRPASSGGRASRRAESPAARQEPRPPTRSLDEHVYGDGWDTVHEGYFSNRAAARPLVAAILRNLGDAMTIADLGGGTGFVLNQLRPHVSEVLRLINLDASPAQLAVTSHARIERLRKSVEQFRRRDLRARGPVLFVMRSVLHYAGRNGLVPLLRHLRRQMRPGERFVHQTVCFARRREADFANRAYAAMETGKWLPTGRELRRALADAGFAVRASGDAPPLPLSVAEVARRYRLTGPRRAALADIFMVWQKPELPYKILACEAE